MYRSASRYLLQLWMDVEKATVFIMSSVTLFGTAGLSGKWHLIPTNSFSRVHTRRMERQMEHATVVKAGIAGVFFVKNGLKLSTTSC